MTQVSPDEARVLRRAVLQLNAKAWGIAFALVGGVGLFLATIVLVIKGGPMVGQHLGLLAIYLPGYSVSIGGAFIGFVYAFVLGYAGGRLVGATYNWFSTIGD